MASKITVFHFGPIEKPAAIFTIHAKPEHFSGVGAAKIGETSKLDGMVSYSIESGEVRIVCLMDPKTKDHRGCGEEIGQDRFKWDGKVIRAYKRRTPKVEPG